MVSTRSILPLAILLTLAAASLAQEIGYKAASDAEQKKTLLLRDFQPESMLHASVHPVDRARFPVFDVHQHVNDAMHQEERVPPADLVKRMDELNIKTIVILTGMWGDKLERVLNEMVKPYPAVSWCSRKLIGARLTIQTSPSRWCNRSMTACDAALGA